MAEEISENPHLTEILDTPGELINLDQARQRFGPKQVDLLLELVQTGDEKADAVIEELDALGGDARQKLRQGIKDGSDQVSNLSPAVRNFLAEVEHVPTWVEPERLKRGSEATLSIGMIWIIFSLGPGSLTHTYSSPSIARVLMRTGNLDKMAVRRLQETGSWNVASIMPGGLLRGADGYIQNLEVRLLHARVRNTLLKHGWASNTLPINQVEMARTWLDFTYVPFTALKRLGIAYTSDELADLYHFWQYIGYLLGIDARLLANMSDQQSAQDLLELIDMTSEGPNEDAKVLVQAMLSAVGGLLPLRAPVSTKFTLASTLTRHFHGDQLADQLGIKKTWMSQLMPLLTSANRLQHAWNNRNSSARQRAVDKTVRTFQAIVMEGTTAYQRNLGDSPEALPETR